MRAGVVDVGSNTVRLLVADIDRHGSIEPVVEERAFLGLGAEIAETGTLAVATVSTTARVCRRYAKRARALGADRTRVIVTAPGRQGSSAAHLVSALREAAQLPVRVLAPEQEGRLAYTGALTGLAQVPEGRVGVVDVGGGSTELVVGRVRRGPEWIRSVDLGSLRLTRLALSRDPPAKREVAAARATARAALGALDPPSTRLALATGGSARALAKLVGRTFDADDVDAAVRHLSRRRSAKVAREAGIDRDRAGTMLAGAILLGEAANAFGRPLTLARGGLREGALLALAAEATDVAA
jgi:exopolyphosphatase/guanosine-5'-triphosphate,3'-diphosphate pyrophosphatase